MSIYEEKIIKRFDFKTFQIYFRDEIYSIKGRVFFRGDSVQTLLLFSNWNKMERIQDEHRRTNLRACFCQPSFVTFDQENYPSRKDASDEKVGPIGFVILLVRLRRRSDVFFVNFRRCWNVFRRVHDETDWWSNCWLRLLSFRGIWPPII